MIISANVRSRNVKRGVSTKQLAQALGFPDEVGLHKMCGRLELSADHPAEFGFLAALYEAMCPVHGMKTKITIELDGKLAATMTKGEEETGRQG